MAVPCLEASDISGYSPLSCRNRWLALQRLRASSNADCILIIVGPDSQYSRGPEVAFNWLLCGSGGRDLLASSLDPRYEECVVCIRADRSTIFCKRRLREEVFAKTSMWESCEVVVATSDEEVDQDRFEARKIGTFMKMVEGCSSIAVPLRGSDMQADPKMTLERWPLVQAFAYDEYGKGFLTMRRNVVNIEVLLQTQVYSSWDLHTVVGATTLATNLGKAWDEALIFQDNTWKVAIANGQAGTIDETVMPLVDYFDYGRLALPDEEIFEMRGLDATGGVSAQLPTPRVLIGPSGTAQIVGEEVTPDIPLHAIWEAVDPVAGISATRTYGLSTMFNAVGQAGQRLQVLSSAYVAAVACCLHLLEGPLTARSGISSSALESELHQRALSFLQTYFSSWSGSLKVTCVLIDTMGLLASEKPQGSGAALLFIRVALSGLSCPATRQPLGAVAYGDSVFCSASATSPQELVMGKALTLFLPAFVCWPSGADMESSRTVKAGLESHQGVGLEPVPLVALGHRPGMRVPLIQQTLPDPLELGTIIENEFRATLAFDLAVQSHTNETVHGEAMGAAWCFGSGKIVFSSSRTGHILLHTSHNEKGVPSVEARDGMVWIPVLVIPFSSENSASIAICRAALTVTPQIMMRLRDLKTENTEAGARVIEDEQLLWLQRLRPKDSEQAMDFLSGVALSEAYGSEMENSDFLALLGSSFPFLQVDPSSACRCIWVSGLPGCGVLDVAVSLAKALGAPLVDLLAHVRSEVSITEDSSANAASTVTELLRNLTPGNGIIVICDVLYPPAQIISALSYNPQFAEAYAVTHVISVLEPAIAYPWANVRHPLMLSRCHRGWVTASFVQDYRQGGSLAVRDWSDLSKLCLCELKACRGISPGSSVPPAGSLISGPLQEMPASVALRSLSLPGSLHSAELRGIWGTCHPAQSLIGIYTPIPYPVDLPTLRQCCLDCLELGASEACPIAGEESMPIFSGLFCIEANLSGMDASSFISMSVDELWNAMGPGSMLPSVRYCLTSRGELSSQQFWSPPLAESYGLIWWYCAKPADISSADFVATRRQEMLRFVSDCRLRPPAPREMWSVDDLPADVLQSLEEASHTMPLPEGVFYDGHSYIDTDLNKNKAHPSLAGLISAKVDHHNIEVEAGNAKLMEIAAMPLYK